MQFYIIFSLNINKLLRWRYNVDVLVTGHGRVLETADRECCPLCTAGRGAEQAPGAPPDPMAFVDAGIRQVARVAKSAAVIAAAMYG